nr:plasmid recombination protein [Enterococcus faecium]
MNERYGQENAVAAVVHSDETTPHLHYAFVPVGMATVFLTNFIRCRTSFRMLFPIVLDNEPPRM